jgi:hypothetical protein
MVVVEQTVDVEDLLRVVEARLLALEAAAVVVDGVEVVRVVALGK